MKILKFAKQFPAGETGSSASSRPQPTPQNSSSNGEADIKGDRKQNQQPEQQEQQQNRQLPTEDANNALHGLLDLGKIMCTASDNFNRTIEKNYGINPHRDCILPLGKKLENLQQEYIPGPGDIGSGLINGVQSAASGVKQCAGKAKDTLGKIGETFGKAAMSNKAPTATAQSDSAETGLVDGCEGSNTPTV